VEEGAGVVKSAAEVGGEHRGVELRVADVACDGDEAWGGRIVGEEQASHAGVVRDDFASIAMTAPVRFLVFDATIERLFAVGARFERGGAAHVAYVVGFLGNEGRVYEWFRWFGLGLDNRPQIWSFNGTSYEHKIFDRE